MVDAGSKRALDDAETQQQQQQQQQQEQEQEQEQEQPTGLNAAVCCSCDKSDVKYRCPRCERITCSLQCCVAHKKQFDCNGKRDRTKFVGVKKFTDADLSSDFFFLEEVSRSTNSAVRSRGQLNANARRYTTNKKRKVATNSRNAGAPINPDIPADWLARFPIAVQLFAEHSAKRGVALTLLAPGMSKRVHNSSYMDTKKKTMYWRVEWAFPSAEVPVSRSEERANERDTLFALLGKFLTPSQENVAIRGKLKKYAVPDWEKHVLLLLRKEFTPASQPQYYRLDGNQSLESNLKRKAVVEFPVITVALVVDADQYPVAHDVIEKISSAEMNATEQQPSTKEPEAMEVEGKEEKASSDKTSSELLTGEGSCTTGKLFSISEEENAHNGAPAQPTSLLIEEIQVAAH
ncbi:Box C/D snoRNA protein 1 [Phytophthora pseudosyringae]|uniref:Box C/D snoRNA protein 1 n=1 Tax=Phytophthora pseudosyringae TaxID=221518 RepID=A0A8T1WHM8_9STRA|nr:Box C/D snoRNA protein 1 [Phytophthora pseudosyringae]